MNGTSQQDQEKPVVHISILATWIDVVSSLDAFLDKNAFQ